MAAIALALICSLSIFHSCDSMLDLNPSDQYSANTFWKTQEHAQAGLSGCYNALYPYYKGQGPLFFEFDMITSNAMAYNEANGTDAISKGVHTPTSMLVAYLWKSAYTGIGRTNTFMDKIDAVKMDDKLKERIKGEALFLRAFYYQSLVDKFGGVPLILSAPNAQQATLPRNTKEEVVNQILEDLSTAATLLPNSYSGSDLGRISKGAALSLKARVLLYNQRWEQAASTAQQTMDLNQYDLFDNYRSFFSAGNKYNKEVIFNVEFHTPDFTTNYDHDMYVLNRPAPLKELVDKYLMIDGKSISESPLFDPAKPYENRDPRLHQSIRCVGYMYNGKITQPSDVVTTGFGNKKYTTYQDDVSIPVIDQNKSNFNPIVIRFAEILLTYAEARNEDLGPDQSVYDALNKIRSRTSVNMPNVPIGLTKEQMRNVIRLERRIELAMEGLYYSDILRWKTAQIENKALVHNATGIAIASRSFDPERDYLWPIPHNQTVLNPNLAQNPKWK